MENRLVWIPVIGILFMIHFCKVGRYNSIYYAGILWEPFQLISVMLLAGLILFR